MLVRGKTSSQDLGRLQWLFGFSITGCGPFGVLQKNKRPSLNSLSKNGTGSSSRPENTIVYSRPAFLPRFFNGPLTLPWNKAVDCLPKLSFRGDLILLPDKLVSFGPCHFDGLFWAEVLQHTAGLE